MTISVPTSAVSGDYTIQINVVRQEDGTVIPIGTTYVHVLSFPSFSKHSYGGGQIVQKLFYVSPTKLYGIGLDGGIWRYNGGGASCTFATCWTQITRNGSFKDDFTLVNNDENDIYGIGLDNQIWHWGYAALRQTASTQIGYASNNNFASILHSIQTQLNEIAVKIKVLLKALAR